MGSLLIPYIIYSLTVVVMDQELIALVYCLICHQSLLTIGAMQGLSQELETGCPILPIVIFLGILFFNGEIHTIYSDYNHKYVFTC